MNYDVTALGELLIDLTQNGISTQGNPILEANPGGAPCNVLALLSKLGYKTAFIGKIGKDGSRAYTKEELDAMLRFANAAAAIVTTRRGALRVMPSLTEIETVLA